MIYAAVPGSRLTKDGREHSQQLTPGLWGGWSCWKTHVETHTVCVCVLTQPGTEHSKGSGFCLHILPCVPVELLLPVWSCVIWCCNCPAFCTGMGSAPPQPGPSFCCRDWIGAFWEHRVLPPERGWGGFLPFPRVLQPLERI